MKVRKSTIFSLFTLVLLIVESEQSRIKGRDANDVLAADTIGSTNEDKNDDSSMDVPAQVSDALAPESPITSQPIEPPSRSRQQEPTASMAHKNAHSLPPRARISPTEEPKLVDIQKPKLLDALTSVVKTFHRSPPAEQCTTIVEEMELNDSTIEASKHLFVLLNRLDHDNHDSPGESILTDKSCENELKALAENLVDRDSANDGSADHKDLITYMDRIVRCKAYVPAQRTILQQIVFLGLEKSLKTTFVQDLLKGSSDYNAVDYIDADGDTLLHLAVLSKAHHVPQALCTLINKIFCSELGGNEGLMTGAWWTMSALMHTNDDGKRPLDVCTNTAMGETLKREFRTTTDYFRFKYKNAMKGGNVTNVDANINAVEELLKSEPTMK